MFTCGFGVSKVSFSKLVSSFCEMQQLLTFDFVNLQFSCSFINLAEKIFTCPKFFEQIRTFVPKFYSKNINPCANQLDMDRWSLTIYIFLICKHAHILFTLSQLRWPSDKIVRPWSCRLVFDSESGQTNVSKIGIHSFLLDVQH